MTYTISYAAMTYAISYAISYTMTYVIACFNYYNYTCNHCNRYISNIEDECNNNSIIYKMCYDLQINNELIRM